MSIFDQLLTDPYHFQFYQAIRLLEQVANISDIEFENNPHLNFSPSEIEGIHPTQVDTGFTVVVPFMGIFGVCGTHPVYHTETAREAMLRGENGFKDWYNIFTNRAVHLQYQGWRKYQLPVHYESFKEDRITPCILALSGLGTPHLIENLGFHPDLPKGYAGRLSNPRRSPGCIADIIGEYFQVCCNVTPWVEKTEQVPNEYQTNLGISNTTLGESFFLGSTFIDYSKTYKVSLGPLSFEEFQNFLPGQEWRAELESLLKFTSGMEFAFEIQLILKSQDVPPWTDNMPLGWMTWIYSETPDQDDSQTTFVE